MPSNQHLDKLASWWAVHLPHVSLEFRAEFKEQLLKQLERKGKAIVLQTHPVLSAPIMDAVLYTKVDTAVTLATFIRELQDSHLWTKIWEDLILVEEGPLPFSSSPRLLLEDGTTSNYCVHCMSPIVDGQDYCKICENGTAVCLGCSKKRAIPTIGLDGVCEGCMLVELNNQLYELGLENERRYISQMETW